MVNELTEYLSLEEGFTNATLDLEQQGDTRYLRDLKINLKNTLSSEYLDEKATALIALSIAANQKNKVLIHYYSTLAKEKNASVEEIAEAVSCASLLAANNVLYRFRHFSGKEKYDQIPARIKMNIMANPVTGKELFELMSLAVSAVNGCERCVHAHEQTLVNTGMREEKIFDAIRLASVVVSLDRIVY